MGSNFIANKSELSARIDDDEKHTATHWTVEQVTDDVMGELARWSICRCVGEPSPQFRDKIVMNIRLLCKCYLHRSTRPRRFGPNFGGNVLSELIHLWANMKTMILCKRSHYAHRGQLMDDEWLFLFRRMLILWNCFKGNSNTIQWRNIRSSYLKKLKL